MQINTYLMFNGQCEEAFHFYEKALGGKIQQMSRYEGMPGDYQVSPGYNQKIMHARITVGDVIVMGSDAPPDRYQKPAGIQVSITVTEPADADRVFQALSEGGEVQMPMQETFWALRFGMLVDRFSIPWMVDCEKPAA